MKIIVYSAANQHVSAFVVNNRKTRLTWIPKVYDSGTATLQDTFPGIFGLYALREVWYVLRHLEMIRVLVRILIVDLSCKLLRNCASGFCEYYVYLCAYQLDPQADSVGTE